LALGSTTPSALDVDARTGGDERYWKASETLGLQQRQRGAAGILVEVVSRARWPQRS